MDRFFGKKEAVLERSFVKRLKGIGCLVFKFVSPGFAGVPDRLLVSPKGIIYLVELKRPGEALRPLQKVVFKLLAEHHVRAHVVDSEDALNQFIEMVKTQDQKKEVIVSDG